jgi:hypothetical protein
MKLTTRQDIEAPLDFVYARLQDFDQFERKAMRRGAEVERTDRQRHNGVGAAWRVRFVFRGRPRLVEGRFIEADVPNHLAWALTSGAMDGTLTADLVALSAKRTRLILQMDIRPKTLAAKLLVQSMRLAKGRVQRKLDAAGNDLAGMIEAQARGTVA